MVEVILDTLIDVRFATSKREAREFIKNGAVLVNGDKIIDTEYVLSQDKAIENRFIVIRRGKKLYALVKF